MKHPLKLVTPRLARPLRRDPVSGSEEERPIGDRAPVRGGPSSEHVVGNRRSSYQGIVRLVYVRPASAAS